MRILHAVPELLPSPPVLGGGVERLAAEWAAGLAAQGHEVHLATPPAPVWPDGPLLWKGVVVHPLDTEDYRQGLARLADRLRPDLVHLHNRPGWAIDVPKPVVVSLHNPPSAWAPPLSPPVDVAEATRGADLLLAVSQWLAALVAPSASAPVDVVAGHVDVDNFRPLAGPRWPRTIVFAGKLDPNKGLDVLLDAFDLPTLAGWRLVVCSPLPPVSGFERWQADVLGRLDCHPRVQRLVPLFEPRELARVLGAATVVAVPSVGDEALGLVSAEAQACGTPVVVSDSGGLPETVDPGQTGLVVARGDPVALAEAIVAAPDLPGDPRSFAAGRFSLETRLESLGGWYQKLGGSGHTGWSRPN